MNQDFVADKVIGILIMVLSVCGVIGGVMVMAGMGMLAAATSQAAQQGGQDAAGAAAAAGMFGMTGAILGFAIIAMCVVSIAVGFGIMKSAKWGFVLGSIWNGIGTVLNLVSFNVLGLLISGAILTYCILRMSGNVGPKPA